MNDFACRTRFATASHHVLIYSPPLFTQELKAFLKAEEDQVSLTSIIFIPT